MSTVTTVESIAELTAIQSPEEGQTVYVKFYYQGLNKGGGKFIYASGKKAINDYGLTINGWVREFDCVPNVFMFGAIGDNTNNDTDAFQKAVDAVTDLYVPRGVFLCNVNLKKSFNITGSGKESILKPYDINKPILTNINISSLSWSNDSVSNLALKSSNFTGVGFSYGVLPAVNDYYGVGRVVMNNVWFSGFMHGIRKVNGNIGNKYYNCNFENCKYGVYASSNQVAIPNSLAIMHSGCDMYYSCNFSENAIAGAAYYDKTHGTGQWLFNHCTFQFNKGFGLFMDFDIPSTLFSPIIIMNSWFEENGGNQVVIDRVNGTSQSMNSEARYISGTIDVVVVGSEDSKTRLGIGVDKPKSTLHIHDKSLPMLQLTSDSTGSEDRNNGGLIYVTESDLMIQNKENGRLYLVNSAGMVELDLSGNFLSRKGKIGYGGGAGSYILQYSFKDRSVTCNFPSGCVRMAASALGANSSVAFVLENNFIYQDDVVIVNVRSMPSGNSDLYSVRASNIKTGSCHIILKNESNTILSEYVEVNFCIVSCGNS
ncbi:hypothetical protein J8Z68_14420 [Acinetobacter nosocomialis]|uniref:hypothetical protein n=1 Tax=Acinetobacter nosocomialis TaxID=106654 RepID=UPI001AE4B37A|nr:hypothetical protein [Acinetobacter nosocomialis]MBP1506013.1 hypothetical protein [Acinetobacter nosocomialis]